MLMAFDSPNASNEIIPYLVCPKMLTYFGGVRQDALLGLLFTRAYSGKCPFLPR